jgi:fucose 4-O-acetylase-like acetyltransferase
MTINVMELVVLACFVLAVLSLLVLVYLSYRYLEFIETMLSNSSFVVGNKNLYSRAGLIGRVMRICTVSILLTVPKLFVYRGLVDSREVDRFPVAMRCVLVVLWNLMLISFLIFICMSE